MKTRLLIVCVSLTLTGCVIPFRPPPEAVHIQLTRANNSQVVIDKMWFERSAAGGLRIRGYVVRRVSADDTSTTHLDAVFFDAEGKELARTTTAFAPAQLPQRHRLRGVGEFEIPLSLMPPGTVRIEIHAHEEQNSNVRSHP